MHLLTSVIFAGTVPHTCVKQRVGQTTLEGNEMDWVKGKEERGENEREGEERG